MAKVEKRTVSLPQEHAAYIDDSVASGAYPSRRKLLMARRKQFAALQR